ncbi:MAG: MFS transporter [Bacillota bacterium]|nr:MFS transporter [Bacillota bacterium]
MPKIERGTLRTIIVFALACFVVGGVAPAFMSDLVSILIMRGIFGVGLGFLVPLAVNLVADFYDGEERAVMMGWHSAAVNLGGLLFMFIGTLLATISWNAAFYVYLIGLVIAVWVIIKLPEPEKITEEKQEKARIPSEVLILIIGVLLFNALFYVLMIHLPVMVNNEGLGHASQAGTALTLFMVGGFFGGMIFRKTSGIFGSYTNACGWFSTGLGVGLVAMSHNIFLITIGSFWAGMSMATTMPDYLIKISRRAPMVAVATALALASGAAGLGQFLSPILFEQLVILFSREIGRFPIIAGSIILLTGGLINLIIIFSSRFKKGNKHQAA